MNKIIAHLDMDAFFAAVEERNSPQFAGKPIVVGAEPEHGRGVVSTANYKAREYGIHSAMPIFRALQVSELAKKQGKPEVVFLPPDFAEYQKSSEHVLQIIKKHSNLVEQASIDEFYFSLSHLKSFAEAEKICKKIKEEIKAKERLTCSIGLAPNKLIAKIAAGIKKPDGLFLVKPEDSEKFLEPFDVKTLPGVGPKTAELLYAKNIKTIKDLKRFSIEDLVDSLGKWGQDIYFKARGEDDSLIVEDREVKSIGEQNTFYEDTFDILFISEQLDASCQRVFNRFLKSGFSKFKTIAIVVRFSDFKTVTSAKSLKTLLGKGDGRKFQFEALRLLLPFLDRRKNPALKKIRLLGVRIENLIN